MEELLLRRMAQISLRQPSSSASRAHFSPTPSISKAASRFNQPALLLCKSCIAQQPQPLQRSPHRRSQHTSRPPARSEDARTNSTAMHRADLILNSKPPPQPSPSSSPSPSNTAAPQRSPGHLLAIPLGLFCSAIALYLIDRINDGALSSSIFGHAPGFYRAQEPLNPSRFATFTLVHREPVSDTGAILTLRPAHTETLKDARRKNETLRDAYAGYWRQGVWSVEVMQPELMISRRYTPLPPVLESQGRRAQDSEGEGVQVAAEDTSNDLRIFVRRYPQGETSSYLHALQIGANVEVRGGFADYRLPADVAEVLFVAGGTGIAPAMQLAHTLRLRAREMQDTSAAAPRLQVLWASRSRQDCLGAYGIESASALGAGQSWVGRVKGLVGLGSSASGLTTETVAGDLGPEGGDAQLQVRKQNAIVWQLAGLKDADGQAVATRFFVDEDGSFIKREDIARGLAAAGVSEGALGRAAAGGQAAAGQAAPRRRIVLVSGPDGFVDTIAGPKVRREGVELQGPLAGLLGQVDTSGWEVFKL